jgi:HSP20 family molecular chaperone IbpA
MTNNGKQTLNDKTAIPCADVIETPERYVVRLDMPGTRKETISVTLEEGILQVKAAVEPHHADNASVLYRELATTSYQRAFTLGEDVDRNSVDAVFEDGVLTLKLFKTPETKPKQITIN